jgi:hypothetical protein
LIFSRVILIAVVLLWLAVYFYKVDRLYPQIPEDLKKRRSSISNQGNLALKSWAR